jgi:imidazolonepropionase-like amidohydrolase
MESGVTRMRRFHFSLAVLVVVAGLAGLLGAHPSEPPALVINHIAIIDTRTGKLLENQAVVIQEGRIVSIEPAKTALGGRGSTLVDGRGKYLIPGLWDCHIHLSWTTDSALPLLTALGITEVRDLGGKLTQIEEWRARIADGTVAGPHIMRVGPILNGKSFNAYQFVPGSTEATRGAVRLLTFLGMDEIKVHRRMPSDWYYAALDESKKQHIRLVGHIPTEVTPAEASQAGQYMIEHTETLFEGTFSAKLSDAQLPGAIHTWLATEEPDKLFAEFVKNGTWVDPTVAGYLEVADMFDPKISPDPRYRYVAASQRKKWEEQQKQHPMSAEEVRSTHEHMNELVEVTARMYKDHVRMVAGTDAAGPRLVGFSLHRELATFVREGMTPLEALQTATLNPAIAFERIADMGTVETGKVADLVLLDANPLVNIENTQRINAVIEDGKLYRRSDLDKLLSKAERLAAVR